MGSSAKTSLRRWPLRGRLAASIVLGVSVVAAAMLLVACGGDPDPTPTPAGVAQAIPTARPAPAAPPGDRLPTTPRPTPRPPVAASQPAPAPTPEPTSTPVPLTLDLLAPQDGVGVEIGALRVLGRTRPDAVVAVNGEPVEVEADGTFVRDLILEDGANLIEVSASDLLGRSESAQVVAFFVASSAGLPFTLLYPTDGLDTDESTVAVLGSTRPDAVVGVNGVPVDVNTLGIFSHSLALEEGANLVEVVAADIDGNVRFQTIAVFYLP